MRIFKFGGASVKDAAGVKNLVRVLRAEGLNNTLIVISAMGKMTNAFEEIVHSIINSTQDLENKIKFVRSFHQEIIDDLFEGNTRQINNEVTVVFDQLSSFVSSEDSEDYDFIYDQIVGYGEILSTKIVSLYLQQCGIENNWLDVRTIIKTNSNYRDANVDWTQTKKRIESLNTDMLYITQGFLGANEKGETTTLGREGSDFSAAIFAHCLNASSLTIWKDVDGVLNADPRHFESTVLLNRISYDEAIEMAFYGASVIHPKTLKPLENKNIPLYVRSFYDLNGTGTIVGKGHYLIPETPCFIVKKKQLLVSITALDFSFMVEHNLSEIFKILHDYKLKVNLIQNSALSFSVCLEDKYHTFDQFIEQISVNYNVNVVKDVCLYTIRHADEQAKKSIEAMGEVLLRQATKGTIQMII